LIFNSYVFIFAFLPVVFAGCWLLGFGRRQGAVFIWLSLASLFFLWLVEPGLRDPHPVIFDFQLCMDPFVNRQPNHGVAPVPAGHGDWCQPVRTGLL